MACHFLKRSTTGLSHQLHQWRHLVSLDVVLDHAHPPRWGASSPGSVVMVNDRNCLFPALKR